MNFPPDFYSNIACSYYVFLSNNIGSLVQIKKCMGVHQNLPSQSRNVFPHRIIFYDKLLVNVVWLSVEGAANRWIELFRFFGGLKAVLWRFWFICALYHAVIWVANCLRGEIRGQIGLKSVCNTYMNLELRILWLFGSCIAFQTWFHPSKF